MDGSQNEGCDTRVIAELHGACEQLIRYQAALLREVNVPGPIFLIMDVHISH